MLILFPLPSRGPRDAAPGPRDGGIASNGVSHAGAKADATPRVRQDDVEDGLFIVTIKRPVPPWDALLEHHRDLAIQLAKPVAEGVAEIRVAPHEARPTGHLHACSPSLLPPASPQRTLRSEALWHGSPPLPAGSSMSKRRLRVTANSSSPSRC